MELKIAVARRGFIEHDSQGFRVRQLTAAYVEAIAREATDATQDKLKLTSGR
jgi:hypothetical protein